MAVNNIKGGFNTYSITLGDSGLEAAGNIRESNNFSNLVSSIKNSQNVSNIKISKNDSRNFSIDSHSTLENTIQTKEQTRLNGDIASDFTGAFTSPKDKFAAPQGAAREGKVNSNRTIDKTSLLYEKSLELESYFVKQLLSSMRSTLGVSNLGNKDSYAKKMYEDMLYDEYATSLTKNAGFGLADQIYLSLV